MEHMNDRSHRSTTKYNGAVQTVGDPPTIDDVIQLFVLKAVRFAGVDLPSHGKVAFEITLRDGKLHRPILTLSDSDDNHD